VDAGGDGTHYNTSCAAGRMERQTDKDRVERQQRERPEPGPGLKDQVIECPSSEKHLPFGAQGDPAGLPSVWVTL
jgi:hypothetical protein